MQMRVATVVLACMVFGMSGDGCAQVDASGPVLGFRATVGIEVAAGPERESLEACLRSAFAAIPGVELVSGKPEWIVRARTASVAGDGAKEASLAVATTIVRPFRGVSLLRSFARPEYRDLVARLADGLEAPALERIDVVDRGSGFARTCKDIATAFDKSELGKKRLLIEDIRDQLDPDG